MSGKAVNELDAWIGAAGVILGAALAVFGSVVAEVFRQRGERRRWHLDRRLDVYGELLDSSRRARNEAYDSWLKERTPDPNYRRSYTSLVPRAELIASDASIKQMRLLRDTIFNDIEAARRHGIEGQAPDGYYLTSYPEWLKQWNSLQNTFRSDLGLPPAVLDVSSHIAVRQGATERRENALRKRSEPDASVKDLNYMAGEEG